MTSRSRLSVPKIPRNPPHDDAIDEINCALLAILPKKGRIRIQSALSIAAASSEPEPDLNKLRGTFEEFAPRKRKTAREETRKKKRRAD
jgi:hypothetical protein